MSGSISETKGKNYFPALDGLRFLAFLLVFIHHAPSISTNPVWAAIKTYGWMGVDLFLCLSAFLFARLLYAEYQRTGKINILFFYIRRTLRIWPLYYLFVIVMILATIYMGISTKTVFLRALGMLTFTDDFITAYTLRYTPVIFSVHLWTIAYEEQFYAIIPWALHYLFRISQHAKTLILVAVMGLGFAIRAGFIWMQVPHPAIWVLPFTHFEAILFGLMIGLGLLDPILRKIPRPLIALTGIIALVAVCYLPDVQVVSWYLMLTYPLTGAGMALILYAVLHTDNLRVSQLLSNKPMAFLGKISYGLYVYHFLALGITSQFFKVTHINHWLWVLLVFILPLLLTIALSALSYLFIERPFLRLKDRFTIVLSRPA